MESQLVNFAGVFFGLIPLLLIIYTTKEIKPVYHGYWIYGFLLIILAAALLAMLDSLTHIVLGIEASGVEDKITLKDIKSNLAIWTYVGPATIAALGVNLITEFITKEKPLSDKS